MHRSVVCRIAATLGALIVLLAAGCMGPGPAASPTPPPLAKELVLYTWAEYMPQAVLDAFAVEYGVHFTYVTFDSLEEAIASLRAGQAYDLVIMDNDFITMAIAENLLAEIDYDNIPNFRNISPNFRDLAYDRGNRHSVPYCWGITALVVRTDLVAEPVTKWADLWAPGFDGKIGVRRGAREMIGMALKSLGYSINSENSAELKAAEERLAALEPRLVYVDPYGEGAVPQLLSGEIAVLVGWNQDAIMGREANPSVTYVFPDEGAMLWGDSLGIPATSANRHTAEVFLNFLLRPEISAMVVNDQYYPSANEAAAQYIEPALLNDPLVVPPKQDLQGSEILLPLSTGGRQLYDQILERVAGPGE